MGLQTSATVSPAPEPPWPATAETAEPLLAGALRLVEAEMDAVNRMIQQRMDSNIALIQTLGSYIIQSGGKRMRPLVLLLSAKACNCRTRDHITLAAVVEFIHTASLLHDDVVDDSALRRGRPTANDRWGSQASILVGDFLYSRCFEMLVEVDKMDVMRILATTTNAIAEGEVMQLMHAHSPDTTEHAYLEAVRRKTAKLFASAAGLGAVIGEHSGAHYAPLAGYGMHLGIAFQLVDDVMDYTADERQMGKNAGDDLTEGRPTLPLIQAMRVGSAAQAGVIRQAIENGESDKINEVLAIVESTGALAYTAACAKQQSAQAIDALLPLPESPLKQALIDLAHFTVSRNR